MPQLTEDSHRFCIAPMLDWTDRHARFFLRLFSKRILLYTEMVTANAINFGDSERFLQFNEEEHPLALQLGGSDPEGLIKACNTAKPYQYDEINLNVGCPSDRVQSGRFGACLMLNPALVAECYQAMDSVSNVPVSIKCRIGVDDQDSEVFLHTFIQTLYDCGCRIFVIHARKAWLKGLSPKQNREIPPLHYDRVYRIKTQFPDAKIIINGGIKTMDATVEHLAHCDGVMIGREAYHNPYILANIDQELFNEPTPAPSREEILKKMVIYIEQECQKGVKLNHITRHMLGLYHGMPGARKFRRQLSGSNIQAGIREIRKTL